MLKYPSGRKGREVGAVVSIQRMGAFLVAIILVCTMCIPQCKGINKDTKSLQLRNKMFAVTDCDSGMLEFLSSCMRHRVHFFCTPFLSSDMEV